jgi:hypothetical protein
MTANPLNPALSKIHHRTPTMLENQGTIKTKTNQGVSSQGIRRIKCDLNPRM